MIAKHRTLLGGVLVFCVVASIFAVLRSTLLVGQCDNNDDDGSCGVAADAPQRRNETRVGDKDDDGNDENGDDDDGDDDDNPLLSLARDSKLNANSSALVDDEKSNIKQDQQAKVQRYILPIVVETGGELGNHLSRNSYGRAVQLMAEKRLFMPAKIIVRSRPFRTYEKRFGESKEILTSCFPNIVRNVADYNVFPYERKKKEIDTRKRQQALWLGNALADKVMLGSLNVLAKRPDQMRILEALGLLRNIINDMQDSNGDRTKICHQTIIDKTSNTTEVVAYNCLPPDINDDQASFSLPFMLLTGFGHHEHFDLFYDEMLDYLHFNESGFVGEHRCCEQTPDPDESVFHFRNFVHEVKQSGFMPIYSELSPKSTATVLFGHLRPGERVAITSRFSADESERMRDMVYELEKRNLTVRVLSGQEAYQDFCFLKRARKHMVSQAISTFSLFAGLISDDQSLPVTKYFVDTKSRVHDFERNFTHPKLTRIQFQMVENPYPQKYAQDLDKSRRVSYPKHIPATQHQVRKRSSVLDGIPKRKLA